MGGGRSAGRRRGAGTGWGAVRGRRAGRPPEGPTSDGQIRACVMPGQGRRHSKPRMLSPVTLGHTDTAPGFLQHHRCRSGHTPLIRSLSVSPGEGTPTSLPTTPTKPAPCSPLPPGSPWGHLPWTQVAPTGFPARQALSFLKPPKETVAAGARTQGTQVRADCRPCGGTGAVTRLHGSQGHRSCFPPRFWLRQGTRAVGVTTTSRPWYRGQSVSR